MDILILILQSEGGLGVVENAYRLLKEGGVLMAALLAIYFQNKFYMFMITKLEEKHTTQVTWLQTELEELSRDSKERSRQDTELIRELTRGMK